MHRMKVPPTLNQFTKTLDKNDAITLFKFFNKYKPEDKAQKKQRLLELAKVKAAAKGGKIPEPKRPQVLKFGLSNITSLIERGEASLVVIAHDVNPIELVLWLPTLCRKMNVPYVIVKGKARLGHLVHRKTCACLCITDKILKKEDKHDFSQLLQIAREKFNDKWDEIRKQWGGMELGPKAEAVLKKRAKQQRKLEERATKVEAEVED